MTVSFTFDDAAMVAAGHKREDVVYTVKDAFAEYGLPCVAEVPELVFEDVGGKNDYACMWNIILDLLLSDWFMESAASCVWQEDGREEDVLAQAWKVKELAAEIKEMHNGCER